MLSDVIVCFADGPVVMNFSNILYRISQSTVILMSMGWVAVVCTALFLKGGHPPLSAIVGIGVVMASWVLGSLGLICGLASIRGSQKGWTRFLFVALNAGLLAFSFGVLYL